MLLQGEYKPSFPLRLMTKDLRLALGLADQLKVNLPVGRAARDHYGEIAAKRQR